MDVPQRIGEMLGEAYAASKSHAVLIQQLVESIKTLTDVVELLDRRLKDLEAWTEVP